MPPYWKSKNVKRRSKDWSGFPKNWDNLNCLSKPLTETINSWKFAANLTSRYPTLYSQWHYPFFRIHFWPNLQGCGKNKVDLHKGPTLFIIHKAWVLYNRSICFCGSINEVSLPRKFLEVIPDRSSKASSNSSVPPLRRYFFTFPAPPSVQRLKYRIRLPAPRWCRCQHTF